MIKDINLPFV